jgi:hypothetical protein
MGSDTGKAIVAHEYKVLRSDSQSELDALLSNAAEDGFMVRDFHVVLMPEEPHYDLRARLVYVALMIKVHPDPL